MVAPKPSSWVIEKELPVQNPGQCRGRLPHAPPWPSALPVPACVGSLVPVLSREQLSRCLRVDSDQPAVPSGKWSGAGQRTTPHGGMGGACQGELRGAQRGCGRLGGRHSSLALELRLTACLTVVGARVNSQPLSGAEHRVTQTGVRQPGDFSLSDAGMEPSSAAGRAARRCARLREPRPSAPSRGLILSDSGRFSGLFFFLRGC